jgi:hypothetical protein
VNKDGVFPHVFLVQVAVDEFKGRNLVISSLILAGREHPVHFINNGILVRYYQLGRSIIQFFFK